ncbi:DUF2538 family protein [Paenibacillus peoriae]|uniref:DUF2538 family protein n=1 Tax=Paenibacillus TaxID=44249 RepID=UPI00026C687D|nr:MULTISPECIES: DUF2538 family protein [Paenibacillus]MEC0182315.1 DUF2538 family protein [Paenibacillus peoriae]
MVLIDAVSEIETEASGVYFVNETHQSNFYKLVQFYHSVNDPEYKSLCYILALPEIHNRTNGKFGEEGPMEWMYKFQDKEVEVEDLLTKEKSVIIDRIYEEDERGNGIETEAYSTLSSGYRKLILLGVNLFNSSYDDFNLCDALGTWGNELIKVYQQAVLVRLDREVN